MAYVFAMWPLDVFAMTGMANVTPLCWSSTRCDGFGNNRKRRAARSFYTSFSRSFYA